MQEGLHQVLVEKRNRWFASMSGRRIEEALDSVRLFERDVVVVEVWVEHGNIEKAKDKALDLAFERDRSGGRVPAPWFLEVR